MTFTCMQFKVIVCVWSLISSNFFFWLRQTDSVSGRNEGDCLKKSSKARNWGLGKLLVNILCTFWRVMFSVFTSIHFLLFSTVNCDSSSCTFLFQLWSISCQLLCWMFGTFIMSKAEHPKSRKEGCETYAPIYTKLIICLEILRYAFGWYFSRYKDVMYNFLPCGGWEVFHLP